MNSPVLAALAVALSLHAGLAAAGSHDRIARLLAPHNSTGTYVPGNANPVLNNDDTPGVSANAASISAFLNSAGTLDVEYAVSASGGVTEYQFNVALLNNTGVPWAGMRFELGYGIGSGFVRSGEGDGLDFDAPDWTQLPASPTFATLDRRTDVLAWSGTAVPPLRFTAYGFAIDVPDGLALHHPEGLERYTLRAIPLPVPEPSAAVLAVAGLGAMLTVVRRRRPR